MGCVVGTLKVGDETFKALQLWAGTHVQISINGTLYGSQTI